MGLANLEVRSLWASYLELFSENSKSSNTVSRACQSCINEEYPSFLLSASAIYANSRLMDKRAFLNPVEEAIQDSRDGINSQVLIQYMPKIEENPEEELEILLKMPVEEAAATIQRRGLYEEQQAEGSPAFIREVERYECIIRCRKLDLQSQNDIKSYFFHVGIHFWGLKIYRFLLEATFWLNT